MRGAERDRRNDEIVRLYESGLSLSAVGGRVGLHKTGVRYVLQLRGIAIRSSAPGVSDGESRSFADRHLAGESVHKIARDCGRSYWTVKAAIVRRGVEIRPKPPVAARRSPVDRSARRAASDARRRSIVAARAAGATLAEIGTRHGISRERVRQILAEP